MKILEDYLPGTHLDRSLTHCAFAKILRVNKNAVTGWEINRHQLPARMTRRIIRFLGYVPAIEKQASLSEGLFQFRQILGYSQEQAAKRMRGDESNIREIELDKQHPRTKIAGKIDRYIFLAEEN